MQVILSGIFCWTGISCIVLHKELQQQTECFCLLLHCWGHIRQK